MKAIKIEYGDAHTWAKPLTLGQLEDLEELINEINEEAKSIRTSETAAMPLSMLRKETIVVKAAVNRYDPEWSAIRDMSPLEISTAFGAVLTGSGLQEVPEGEEKPVWLTGANYTPISAPAPAGRGTKSGKR